MKTTSFSEIAALIDKMDEHKKQVGTITYIVNPDALNLLGDDFCQRLIAENTKYNMKTEIKLCPKEYFNLVQYVGGLYINESKDGFKGSVENTNDYEFFVDEGATPHAHDELLKSLFPGFK